VVDCFGIGGLPLSEPPSPAMWNVVVVVVVAPMIAAAATTLLVVAHASLLVVARILLTMEDVAVKMISGRMVEHFITPKDFVRSLTLGTLAIWLTYACDWLMFPLSLWSEVAVTIPIMLLVGYINIELDGVAKRVPRWSLGDHKPAVAASAVPLRRSARSARDRGN